MLQITLLFPILLSIILGGLIGFERERYGKEAGIRTHALITLGATLFTLVSYRFDWGPSSDPSRIAAQVVIGIGFLGAGLLMQNKQHITNVTTAAGIWVCAALGMMIGVGWYFLSVITTLLVVLLLILSKMSHGLADISYDSKPTKRRGEKK